MGRAGRAGPRSPVGAALFALQNIVYDYIYIKIELTISDTTLPVPTLYIHVFYVLKYDNSCKLII